MAPGRITTTAQQVKHAGMIARKGIVPHVRAVQSVVEDRVNPALARLAPYRFDPARYRRSFLAWPAPELGPPVDYEPRVFTFWTGDNDLTPNRRASLERMRETIGLPVVLVTPDTLPDWIVPNHPLHAAYQHLSLVHRSDYLRAYFLHHHGGGYCDIKQPVESWAAAAQSLRDHPDTWLLASPVEHASWVGRHPGRLGADLRRHYRLIGASGSFLGRAGNPLTAEWVRELDRRLDYFAPQLAAFPGEIRGEVVGYPISWNVLLNHVLHPLCLKHHEHVRTDPRLRLSLLDYL
ncbi:MAG TPA: hypothetical protein P5181_00675 [Dermatophilaceae bacterium]|nr:hypothetical protein [Dermatophilaceae bacterium]